MTQATENQYAKSYEQRGNELCDKVEALLHDEPDVRNGDLVQMVYEFAKRKFCGEFVLTQALRKYCAVDGVVCVDGQLVHETPGAREHEARHRHELERLQTLVDRWNGRA